MRKWISPPAWLAIGYAVATVGWAEGHSLTLLCLVPTLWALAPRAVHAFALYLGYMLATTDAIALGAVNFANSTAETWLLEIGWVAVCAAVASVWLIAHIPFKRSRLAGFIAGLCANIALLFPPLWLFGSVAPIIGWGFVLGGTELAGLIAGAAMSVGLGALLRARPLNEQAVVVALLAAVAVATSDRTDPEMRNHAGVHGVHVRWPGPGREDAGEVIDRIQKVGLAATAARQASPELVSLVFPESVLGDLMGRIDTVFDLEVVQAAKRNHLQIMVGADENLGTKGRVGLLVVNPDGQIVKRFARQPMPIALWRPWAEQSYLADWALDSSVELPDGRLAYLSFCYEDLVPGLFIAGMRDAARKPDLVISVANDWWMASDKGALRQGKAVEAMARLYAVPIIRAVNMPASRQ